MTQPPAGGAPATITRDLPNQEATEALGRAIAPLLGAGDVVALYGELGAGKTTLARAILYQLGHQGDVPSPTFTLVQIYDTQPAPVWHFDLYRIGAPEEVVELGVDEALAEAISLIEWPENMGSYLPVDCLDIELSYGDSSDGRRVEFRGHGRWAERLREAGDGL